MILLAVVTGIALAMGSAQLLQHLFYGSASVNIWSYALAAVHRHSGWTRLLLAPRPPCL